MKWKTRFINPSSPNNLSRKDSILSSSIISADQQTLIYSWRIEDLYVYIGADRRIVNPFDMNEYRYINYITY